MKAVTVYRHSTVKLSYFCSRVTDLIALLLTTSMLSLNINFVHVEKKKNHVSVIQAFVVHILMKEQKRRSRRTHAETH